MKTQTRSQSPERGIALILALIAILVLGVLAATIVATSQSQTWTALNYRLTTQSRYAAEAGVQATMNWLANSYTVPSSFGSYTTTTNPVQYSSNPVVLSAISGVSSNYPDATVVTAFNTAFPSSGKSVTGITNATYTTSATLLRMTPSSGVTWLGSGGGGGVVQTWQITSVGKISGLRAATVQVVATYERSATPIFGYAVAATSAACGAIDFAGTDYTDSYNSNNGTYTTTVQASGGNIATNGNVTLGGSAQIKGSIYALGTTVTTSNCSGGLPYVSNGSGLGSGFDTGGVVTKLSSALNYVPPWGCTAASAAANTCYPVASPSTTAQDVSTSCASVSGCTKNGSVTLYDNGKSTSVTSYTLTPGPYGNLTIDNADVVHMTAGTYDINSLNFAKDGQIVVDSGPVVLAVAGKGFVTGGVVINSGGLSGWNLCANGVTGNPGQYNTGTWGVANNMVSCGNTFAPFSGIPSNLQIVYAGTGTISTTGAPLSSAIYAPNSFVDTTGAAVGMYGSIIAKTFTEASKAPVHYDNALASAALNVGQFRPVGAFSWSKF